MLAMRPGWGGAAQAQGRLDATITPLAQIHCEVSGDSAASMIACAARAGSPA